MTVWVLGFNSTASIPISPGRLVDDGITTTAASLLLQRQSDDELMPHPQRHHSTSAVVCSKELVKMMVKMQKHCLFNFLLTLALTITYFISIRKQLKNICDENKISNLKIFQELITDHWLQNSVQTIIYFILIFISREFDASI